MASTDPHYSTIYPILSGEHRAKLCFALHEKRLFCIKIHYHHHLFKIRAKLCFVCFEFDCAFETVTVLRRLHSFYDMLLEICISKVATWVSPE